MTKDEIMLKASHDGFNAYIFGDGINRNPYDEDTLESEYWLEGWNSAKKLSGDDV